MTAILLNLLVPGGAVVSSWACAIALLAWLRGAWLAIRPPGTQAATAWLAFGALAFIAVFSAQTSAHTKGGGSAGWLLFVWFFSGFAALASAHREALERSLARPAGRSSTFAWLPAFAVPLGIVAAVSVLIAFAAESAGGPIGRAVQAVADGLFLAAEWLFYRIPRTWWDRLFQHLAGLHAGGIAGSHTARTHRSGVNGVGMAIGIVLDVILCAVALFIVVRLTMWVVERLRRREHHRRSRDTVPEERGSIFTWRHLFDQLRNSLAGAVRKLLRRRSLAPVVGDGYADPPARRPPPDPVRGAYVGFLVALDAVRRGRAPAETPRELAARLGADDDLAFAHPPYGGELTRLTDAYQAVRYGDADPEALADRAGAASAVLVAALTGVTSSVGTETQGTDGPATDA